jgi:hypothetical protein
MPTCSCGGVTITCRSGCGCLCSGDIDCTRWCELVVVESAGLLAAGEGGIVRTLKAPDGTERLVVGAMALEAGQDMPLLERGTPLQGCMHGRLCRAWHLSSAHYVALRYQRQPASLRVPSTNMSAALLKRLPRILV